MINFILLLINYKSPKMLFLFPFAGGCFLANMSSSESSRSWKPPLSPPLSFLRNENAEETVVGLGADLLIFLDLPKRRARFSSPSDPESLTLLLVTTGSAAFDLYFSKNACVLRDVPPVDLPVALRVGSRAWELPVPVSPRLIFLSSSARANH